MKSDNYRSLKETLGYSLRSYSTMKKRFAVYTALVTLLLLPALGHSQFLAWNFSDIITDLKESGANPDMAIDNTGKIHITYWQKDEDKLVYAFKGPSDNSWTFELVDATQPNGYRSAIALDQNNNPHVAYQENDNWVAQMRYARRTGTNSWTVEPIPGDPNDGWGDYGPNASITLTERIVHSVDILMDENDVPQIVFFDGWMADNAFPTCTANSNYGFKLHQAYRVSGQWSVKDFGHVRDLHLSCGTGANPDTLPSGDRYGEYVQLVQRADNSTEAYMMSRYNNQLISFGTTFSDTTWELNEIDSLNRLLPGWSWSERWYTIEGVGAHVSSDDNVHLSYTSSLFYGENFCCTAFLNDLAYARVEQDTIIYHEFGVATYRNYTDLTSIGSDSIYIAYTDLNTFQFLLQQSTDGGLTWTKDTIMDGIGIHQTPIDILGDSLHVLIYNSEKDQLILARRHLYLDSANVSPWTYEEVTISENHGHSVDATVAPVGGDTIAFTAFNDNFRDKLFFASATKSSGWTWAIEQIDVNSTRHGAITYGLGPGDEPMVLYSSGDELDLKLAVKSGGNWQYEVIDSAANVSHTDMALSTNDTIHVVFYDDNQNCLRYAKRHFNDTVWIFDFIDCGNQPVGEYPSIQLDANGLPHVAYYDDFILGLKYATQNLQTRAWEIDTVFTTTSTAVGKYASLRLDANGRAKIAHIDEQANFVYLSEKNIAGLWTHTLVDSTPISNIGRPLELELDQFGNAWLAYNYFSNFDRVKLMRRDSVWTEVSVSSTGQLANAFSFKVLGGDLYIIGKKNELQNTGVGMLYAPGGLFVEAPDPLDITEAVQLQNYPNPFSDATTFRMELDKPFTLTLNVYDLFGKRVATVVDRQKLGTGVHEFSFDGGTLASGMYVYELNNGHSRIVKKMVLQR